MEEDIDTRKINNSFLRDHSYATEGNGRPRGEKVRGKVMVMVVVGGGEQPRSAAGRRLSTWPRGRDWGCRMALGLQIGGRSWWGGEGGGGIWGGGRVALPRRAITSLGSRSSKWIGTEGSPWLHERSQRGDARWRRIWVWVTP